MKIIESFDPELHKAIFQEEQRQIDKLELIASENIVSQRVQSVLGSVLTNKYAEGYPRKRYYGGCEYVDIAENLAIERANQIFGSEYANVQPHSGSQANMAVYMAALEPGDKVLGMDLSHGGHLTHGSPVNFSGLLYESYAYGVSKENHLIDFDQVRDLAKTHKPKMIIAGASAYPREIDFKLFREIADEVNAVLLVDMAHIAGIVATGLHNNPIPHAQYVTTTTHKTLRGPRGGLILSHLEFGKKLNSRIFPGIQGGPLCHVIAAKAVAFKEAQTKAFIEYQKQVLKNAKALSKAFIEKDYHVISGGTDNHLILIDLTNKRITGKKAEQSLDLANITVNKNTIPFETQSPFITSGIRLGTPALTSRGLKEKDMEQIVTFIDRVLQNTENTDLLKKIAFSVKEFSNSFPHFEDTLV